MTASMTPKRTIKLNARDLSTLRSSEPVTRVILGLGSTSQAKAVTLALTDRGLTVDAVANAEEARKLAVGRRDTAVVIPVATLAQGGLLTTAKIVTALPTCKIVLLSPLPDDRVEAFAEFIDATVVFETDGLTAIVNAI